MACLYNLAGLKIVVIWTIITSIHQLNETSDFKSDPNNTTHILYLDNKVLNYI